MPTLTGRNLPKLLAELGESGQEVIIGWLVDATHCLFGRRWKPFYTRPEKKKHKRRETAHSDTIKATNQIYFFAVNGTGFLDSKDPVREQLGPARWIMSIDDLFNIIRPTRKNRQEGYLKLFSRTSLGMLLSCPSGGY